MNKPFFLRQQFSDFEAYCESSRHWDLAYNQLDFIIESDKPVTSVRELCIVAHVSERTLEYAFGERFGLSPKTFTLTHRLNNVRKTLTYADPDIDRIYEIAGCHGFFHMGQFSSDYKRLFGEQPSVTLSRS